MTHWPWILGPCVIDNRDTVFRIAEELAALKAQFEIHIIFKASFDKANRSSLKSARGVGLDEGMDILQDARHAFGLPIITDVHEVDQVDFVGAACDYIQIPAFLCRQTDLLVAAAETQRPVFVKKGQFCPPDDVRHIIHKLTESGCKEYAIIERGSCFGHGELINDFKSFPQMREACPLIFDATHSVQKRMGTITGGNASVVPQLAQAAIAMGVDGIFCETHFDPALSPSDAANMTSLNTLKQMIPKLLAIKKVCDE